MLEGEDDERVKRFLGAIKVSLNSIGNLLHTLFFFFIISFGVFHHTVWRNLLLLIIYIYSAR